MTNCFCLDYCCSVIVLRTTPEIYCRDLDKLIGAPQCYNKNKDSE